MPEPPPPLDLAALEARCATYEYSVVQWEEAAATLILTDIPALVARVRALEAVVAKARELVDGYRDDDGQWDDGCVPMAWENAVHELAALLP